jgi:hypothetical protein
LTERRHFLGLKIGKVACVATVAGVPVAPNILLSLASHTTATATSTTATDTAVTDDIAAVGFPWVSAVVMVCCRSYC